MTAAAPIEFKRFEKAGRIARFFNAAEKAGYIHQLSWWSKMAPKGAAARDRPRGPGQAMVHPVVLIGGFYVFFSAYGSFETGDGYL